MSLPVRNLYQSAVRLHQSGDLAGARELYEGILSQFPAHADTLHMLGVLTHQQGATEAAIGLIQQAIGLNRASAAYWMNLATILIEAGRLEGAVVALQAACGIAKDPAPAWFQLGTVYRRLGRLEEAAAAYRAALSAKPDFPEAYNNLGVALEEQGQLDSAIDAYRRALALRVDYGDAINNLVSALAEADRIDELAIVSSEALERRPDLPESHNHYGVVQWELGRLDEGIACFRKALAIRPGFAPALINFAGALKARGDFQEANRAYREALAIIPDSPDAHYGLSELLLRDENYEEGWEHYEWRLLKPESRRRQRPFGAIPAEIRDLAGRRVHLRAEQGLGDTIQFVRFAAILKSRYGAEVSLECQAETVRLLAGQCGLARVSGPLNAPPPGSQIEVPLMSLAKILKVTAATVPGETPYLAAGSAAIQKWRERLAREGDRVRVGLNWAGKPIPRRNRKRTIGLPALQPLLDSGVAAFYSLQKGEARRETEAFGAVITDWSDELVDLSDTAALICALDLVITCDTSIAHLAGALGKPVWVLLPFVADWRWLSAREDSPWYPTMRLFRQGRLGEWDQPVARVAAELAVYRADPARR